MAIEIGQEKIVESSGKYIVTSEICNTGSSPVDVIVTQHPYEPKTGGGTQKIGNVQETTKTIPANQCITVAFGDYSTKPTKTYTDVYEKKPDGTKGKLLDGEINDVVAANIAPGEWGSTKGYLSVQLPYPQRILNAYGPTFLGMFAIESIEGVPEGWRVEMIEPRLGEPYFVSPQDRVNPGILRIVVPPDVEEGITAKITITQRVVGAPTDDPTFELRQNVWVVIDTTPPAIVLVERIPDPTTRTLLVRGQGEDSVSGIDRVRVIFDVDASENWAEASLVLPEGWKFGDDLIYEGTIGPFCDGQTVRTKIAVWDSAGNVAFSETEAITF